MDITWPRNDMRTAIVHRSDSIEEPYEGRVALREKGVAQGGLIDTPDGDWYAFLFRDFGAVGRVPYLVPVEWSDGWPVLGVDGEVPMELDIPNAGQGLANLVASDEFERKKGLFASGKQRAGGLRCLPLEAETVRLRIDCDFRERRDVARFYYSYDGASWQEIGEPLQMRYTLPHFMGYRFGLFSYATQEAGGVADFDYYRVGETLLEGE